MHPTIVTPTTTMIVGHGFTSAWPWPAVPLGPCGPTGPTGAVLVISLTTKLDVLGVGPDGGWGATATATECAISDGCGVFSSQ